MRKTLIAAVAAVAIGGLATGAWMQSADAQNAPAPPPAAGAPAPMAAPQAPWMARMGGAMPWRRPGADFRRGRMGGPATWSLIYTPADRALTTADVQKIAEAFLLWHGNRTWKVTNVTQNADGTISFSFATADGGVIATFSMDSHNGRVRRLS